MEHDLARRRLQVVAYLALCELRDLGGELPECQAARLALERRTAQPFSREAVTDGHRLAEVRHLTLVGGED